MPIRSVHHFHQPTLPLVAKLAKGLPDGTETPHFVLSVMPEFQRYEADIMRLLGQAPYTLYPVHVLGDSVDECFSHWLEQYEDNTGRLINRCDGENRVYPEKGTCLSPECQCKERGRLHIALPAIERALGIEGRYLVTTGSFNDIRYVFNRLTQAQRFAERNQKHLSNLPFALSRFAKTVTHKEGESVHYQLRLDMLPSAFKDSSPSLHGDAYLPFLADLSQTFLAMPLAELLAAMGYSNSAWFVAKYPNLEAAKNAVAQWLANEKRDVLCHFVICEKVKERYQYRLNIGFAELLIHSRAAFREKGFTVDDWRKNAVNDLMPPARLQVEANKRGQLALLNVYAP